MYLVRITACIFLLHLLRGDELSSGAEGALGDNLACYQPSQREHVSYQSQLVACFQRL